MQPSPIAETSRLLRPSFRLCIASSSSFVTTSNLRAPWNVRNRLGAHGPFRKASRCALGSVLLPPVHAGISSVRVPVAAVEAPPLRELVLQVHLVGVLPAHR